ncbi:MAG: UvrD-helicase domain-containing protein, partial [Phycisphaerales bacterium JB064]
MTAQSMRAEPFEVIMASAGTGKTFALTNRMAGLLARGVPVERILAATFTRKAAGEIRERLLSRIARAAADEAEASELSRHAGVDLDCQGWLEALRRLSRGIHHVRIGTLDSLAQSLARSLAPELGLAAPWRMAMDHAADQLRQDVIERVLAD